MPARVFRGLPKVLMRTFREPGDHWWQRHDAEDPDRIQLIFNENHVEIDEQGFQVQTGQPVAFILVSDALAIAPERGGDLTTLFDNDDVLIVNGRSLRVECCTPNSLNQVEVKLRKA